MSRCRVRHIVVGLLASTLVLAGPSAALAQEAPSGSEGPNTTDTTDTTGSGTGTEGDTDADVDPPQPEGLDLTDVVVTSGTYTEALAALGDAQLVLDRASRTVAQNELSIPDLALAVDRIQAAIPRLQAQVAAALGLRNGAREDLDDLVALRYVVEAGRVGPLAVFSDPSAYQDERRVQIVLEAAEQHRFDTMRGAANAAEDATLQLDAAESTIGDVRTLLELRRHELVGAEDDLDRLDGRLEELEAAVSVERRLGTVNDTDLTFVALEAYVTAAAITNDATPACGIDWPVLAAVGRVESRHGTYGDSSLDVAGHTIGEILGIALDGTRNTREILDSDGGALDGDTTYDRAVGPMQFIPTTWARWARDGDGDGEADPHNLYDAATAAGAYLCRAGNFTSAEGARRAVFAYNHSEAYVDTVLRFAEQYRALDISTE